MRNKIFVVVNPKAGGGAGRLLWPRVAAELKKRIEGFDFEESTEMGHARHIAQEAAAAGYRLIIAYGGDGTIHEVVNGIWDSCAAPKKRPILGMISVGTGGDLIKTLGIPKNLTEQVRIAAGPKTRKIDLGLVEYSTRRGKREKRVFINIVSAGLGGEVVRRLSRSRAIFGKKLAYLTATIESYIAWRPKKMTILTEHSSSEDVPWPQKPLVAAIANGRFFGGGMPIAPRANLSDGFLDLVTIGPIHPIKVPLAISFLYSQQISRLSDVHTDRVRNVSLTSEELVNLEIDGEPIGALPATFEILPAAVEVKVP